MEEGVGNELVLLHCRNYSQNDVILYRVEIPFFFTGQLLLKICVNFSDGYLFPSPCCIK